jgi:hypothetical protein
MRRAVFILLHLVCSVVAYSQSRDKGKWEELSVIIEQISEEIAISGGSSAEEAIEYLENLAENPVPINIASPAEMENLPLLTPFMISSLIDYRKEFGDILSLDELSFVPGFDKRTADRLKYFIRLSSNDSPPPLSIRTLVKDSKSQLLFRFNNTLERQKGYTPVTAEEWKQNLNCRYLSFPGRIYLQYKYEYPGRIKFSMTSERDAGEIGADWLGASLSLERAGPFRRIIIGDYSARFGQGLVFWNSFSITSLREPSSLKRNESGIVPYSSTDENRSFRGVAANAAIGKIDLTLFYSNRNVDARIANGGYTSLLITGLHNTTTSLERKRTLGVSIAGENLSYSATNFRIGQTLAVYHFGMPYTGRDSLLLSRTSKFGATGANMSVDGYAVFGRFRLFGETAIDIGGAFAALAGALWSPSGATEFSVQCRNYSREYLSPFGDAYSSGGKTQDEAGISVGAKWNTYRKWIFRSSMDWLPFEKTGKIVAEAEYLSENNLNGYLRFTKRKGGESIRLNILWQISRMFELNARGEVSHAADDKLKGKIGGMLFGELIYSSQSAKFGASFRVAPFIVPDWKLRIYTYERDVLYGFSVPALSGKGIRWYANLRWETSRWLTVWFKLAQSVYFDRDKTGEGLDEISGPSKSDYKIEIRIRF